MTREELIYQIRKKKTFLCVGLDPDLDKIPKHLHQSEDIIFEFNKAIIDATADLCVAYKPNTAFYEAYGISGLISLKKTIEYLNEFYPDHFTIADAKRGDIGNTSAKYAKAFFETFNFDSITVAPYMGVDSVKPFIEFSGKWVIILALTSNVGAYDFQTENLSNGKPLYEQVLETSSAWGTEENLMYVIGATKAEMLKEIRKKLPNHFFLVPGVGAQGGSLQEVCEYGLNREIGLLINSSRGIIYASHNSDFEAAARKEAEQIALQMKPYFY